MQTHPPLSHPSETAPAELLTRKVVSILGPLIGGVAVALPFFIVVGFLVTGIPNPLGNFDLFTDLGVFNSLNVFNDLNNVHWPC